MNVKRAIGPVLAMALAISASTPAFAHSSSRHPRMATMTFSIQVAGDIGPGTTFWLAHGPINGRFGIVRMHRVGRNTYAVQQIFPKGHRATFTYVMGHGAIETPGGPAPGDPVVIIDTVGPLHLNGETLPTIQWQAPIG